MLDAVFFSKLDRCYIESCPFKSPKNMRDLLRKRENPGSNYEGEFVAHLIIVSNDTIPVKNNIFNINHIFALKA